MQADDTPGVTSTLTEESSRVRPNIAVDLTEMATGASAASATAQQSDDALPDDTVMQVEHDREADVAEATSKGKSKRRRAALGLTDVAGRVIHGGPERDDSTTNADDTPPSKRFKLPGNRRAQSGHGDGEDSPKIARAVSPLPSDRGQTAAITTAEEVLVYFDHHIALFVCSFMQNWGGCLRAFAIRRTSLHTWPLHSTGATSTTVMQARPILMRTHRKLHLSETAPECLKPWPMLAPCPRPLGRIGRAPVQVRSAFVCVT